MTASPQLTLWKRLLAPAHDGLRDAAAGVDASDVSAVAALRRDRDPALVALALELAAARRAAARKFPERAATLVADRAGVEQATDQLVAQYKADRFAQLGRTVHDLCCGIGGDTMALARVGDVVGVDHSDVRAWMTSVNAVVEADVCDVERMDLGRLDAFHLDPARRSEGTGRRAWRFEDYRPGPDFIGRLLGTVGHGAIKLGPGVAFDALPGASETEVEVIATEAGLVQAVLWSGGLADAPGRRTATRLPERRTLCAVPAAPPEASFEHPFGAWLYVPDPVVERAGLAGNVARGHASLRSVHPGLGLFTGDEPVDDPWLTSFSIETALPWREKHVRAWLRAHDGGDLVVRTRGGAIDTDAAARTLRGTGTTRYTVFGLRLGSRRVAVVTSPRA